MLEDFDYSFSENGLVAYKEGKLIGHTSINDHLGEENIKVRMLACVLGGPGLAAPNFGMCIFIYAVVFMSSGGLTAGFCVFSVPPPPSS